MMDIVWREYRDNDHELWIDGVNMGWVDDDNSVHCMWMTFWGGDAPDPRDHLIDSQYPEETVFETLEQAKEALLESAIPIYIGGFRGR